jgi:hypothetical protein
MIMNTDQRLREIAERENKATKGPWWVINRPPRSFDDHGWRIVGQNDSRIIATRSVNIIGAQPGRIHREQEFIAHSRQDVPWLLALIKKQREALECYAESTYGGDIARDALNFSPENL